MHRDEHKEVRAGLVRWLVYSVIIPALAIFLRWLVPCFLYGLDRLDPLGMLRSSEVVFLAGVIVAETLGEATGRGASSSDLRRLDEIRALLMVLLVLSLMVFGAFTPLEATDADSDPIWIRTPEGQLFLAWFNLALFLIVFVVAFWTRRQYLTVDGSDAEKDNVALQAKVKEDVPHHLELSGEVSVNAHSEGMARRGGA